VENPFRSEAAAYRFLLVTIGALALIVAAKLLLGSVAALIVFVLELAAVVAYYVRQRSERPEPMIADHVGAPDEKRILVIANETVGGTALRNEIARRSEGFRTDVLVVCPALNSRLKTWTSDEDGARAAASERLERSLGRLRELGIDAAGEVGESDPVQCIEDALRTYGADEIVIATHPEERSNWLERDLVERARSRYALPIVHVVVGSAELLAVAA
jgi:GABA permease